MLFPGCFPEPCLLSTREFLIEEHYEKLIVLVFGNIPIMLSRERNSRATTCRAPRAVGYDSMFSSKLVYRSPPMCSRGRGETRLSDSFIFIHFIVADVTSCSCIIVPHPSHWGGGLLNHRTDLQVRLAPETSET